MKMHAFSARIADGQEVGGNEEICYQLGLEVLGFGFNLEQLSLVVLAFAFCNANQHGLGSAQLCSAWQAVLLEGSSGSKHAAALCKEYQRGR